MNWSKAVRRAIETQARQGDELLEALAFGAETDEERGGTRSSARLTVSLIIANVGGWTALARRFRRHEPLPSSRCYGDPRANEIGSIYQALNFYYLGQEYGAKSEFLDPESGNPIQPIGDRHPRHVSMYKRYAQEEGIEWSPAWASRDVIHWSAVPPDVVVVLRRKARAYQRRLVRVPLPPKHKYALVKGATRKETQHLRKEFEKRNAALIQPYPSEDQRGALTPLPGYDAQPRLVRLSDVQPEEVTWLWRDRIPCGKLTLLEGDPDEGKSTVAYDVAARVSAGRPMPLDSTLREPAGVIILSAEDGLADTIRPRLEAADADLDRIRAFAFEALPTIPDDLSAIEHAITEVGARLVIIDPLVAFFGRAVHAYRDHDVRRALTPLAALADRTRAAVLAIRHLNKARMARAKYRGVGSIGILGAARSALLVARDPEEPSRRLLAPVKQNLSVPAPAVAFSLVAAGTTTRVAWLGQTSHTAEGLLAHPAPEADRAALADAMEFLRAALADGQRPATEVLNEASVLGIAEMTLRRARKALSVSVRRQGFGKDGRFLLALPTNGSDAAHEAKPPNVAGNGNGFDHDHAQRDAPGRVPLS